MSRAKVGDVWNADRWSTSHPPICECLCLICAPGRQTVRNALDWRRHKVVVHPDESAELTPWECVMTHQLHGVRMCGDVWLMRTTGEPARPIAQIVTRTALQSAEQWLRVLLYRPHRSRYLKTRALARRARLWVYSHELKSLVEVRPGATITERPSDRQRRTWRRKVKRESQKIEKEPEP